MKIEAVLFDCDGTMFDTEILSQQMWRDQARLYGVTLPADFFLQITGRGRRDITAYLQSIPGFSKAAEEVMDHRFDLAFWRSIHADCLNKPGLIELFSYLQANHYRVAICSSSPRSYVESLIATVSVPLHYDAIVCGDMVSHTKPDPEIFLTGASLLQVLPEHCLVLEDSNLGILAAHRAGMHPCFLPDTIAPDEEIIDHAEFWPTDMLGVIRLLQHLTPEKKEKNKVY